MANKVIKILGLTELQKDMTMVVSHKMHAAMLKASDRFAGQVGYKAKQKCPMDTGALRSSIHHMFTKRLPEWIQIEVVAGHPNYVRGAGSFTYSSKEGGAVSKQQSTTEYAEHVELGYTDNSGKRHAGRGYMKHGYDWGKTNATRKYIVALDKALKGLI